MENDQTPPSPPPKPAISTYAPTSSKSSNLPIIILSFLLLISISVIAYLYIQIQFLKKQSFTPSSSTQAEPNLTTSPTPTISPTTDQITSWKTYAAETGQFRLKYPTSLVEGPTSGNFRNYMGTDFSLSIGQIENKMSATNNKQFNTLDEYIKADYDDISDKQTILLDNKEVIRFKTQNITRVIFFSVDKKIIYTIDIVLDTSHPEKSVEALRLFDQILSTIKFTN